MCRSHLNRLNLGLIDVLSRNLQEMPKAKQWRDRVAKYGTTLVLGLWFLGGNHDDHPEARFTPTYFSKSFPQYHEQKVFRT